MATIVLVHGIAQEQRSAAELETEWLPSLAGGLENAGHTPLADRLRDGAFTVRMAFYGNKFLSPDHQGLEPDPLTAARAIDRRTARAGPVAQRRGLLEPKRRR